MKPIHPLLAAQLTSIDDFQKAFGDEDTIEGSRIEGVFLSSEDLEGKSIAKSLLNKVDFTGVATPRLDISDCVLTSCNFTASKFPESSWHKVSIDTSRCSGLHTTNAIIKDVEFKNSKLEIANFRFSRLENVIFKDCVLNDVDFYNAQLKNVAFIGCTINKITFASARLFKVDISKSLIEGAISAQTLRGVTISHDQLMQLAPLLAADAGIKIKE